MANLRSDTIELMADRGIPVAQLSIISLAKIHAKDPAELGILEKAASNTGFFYLDLRGDTKGEHVLAHLPLVYGVTEKYFSQPEEVKAKNIRLDIKASQDLGWKKGHGGESFEISRDEMRLPGVSTSHLPQLFRDDWKTIAEFCAGCDEACLALLNSLSAESAVHHHADQPSDTGLKLVLHPSLAKLSDVDETFHTDGGTLTLLFCEDWGIHVFLPDANIWAFTSPREGCALINVANSLQRLSGGKMHSPKHRVTQPFDGAKNRFFLSYFLRPETAFLEEWDAAQ